jgi:hypothetical protein
MVPQLFKKFPYVMEHDNPFTCSQEATTGPYPEPDESSLQPSIQILLHLKDKDVT